MSFQWFKREAQFALNIARMPEVVSSPPRYLMLETINVCNLRCRFCGQSQGRDHFVNGSGRMPFNDFKCIVDKIPPSWYSAICLLTRDGEPLLNRELERYVAYYKSVTGMSPHICTNAMLLTRERSASLIDAGLHSFRSDFCADKTYYSYWRQGGDWDQVYEHLRGYLETAREKKVKVKIIVGEIQADTFPTDAEKLAACERTRNLFKDFPGMVEVFMNTLHTSLGNCEVVKTDEASEKREYTFCHHPWNELAIDFAGRAVTCFRDQRSIYLLGDALKDDLPAIWNGEPIRALRRAIAAQQPDQIPTCTGCDLPWHGSAAGHGGTASIVFNYFRKILTSRIRTFLGHPDGIYK